MGAFSLKSQFSDCGALRYLAPTGKGLPILVHLGSRLVDANELGYFLVRIQVGAFSGVVVAKLSTTTVVHLRRQMKEALSPLH